MSMRAGHIHWDLDALMYLFDHVATRKNVKKVIMVFQPCHYPGGMLAELYTCQMMGEGTTYQDRMRQQV